MEGIINGLKIVLEEYGLYAALVVYFLGRDTWREHRLATANQKLQDEMRGVMIPLVKTTSEALTKSSTALEQNSEALEEGRKTLEAVQVLMRRAIEAA